jgi:heme exporter protein B
MNMKPGLFTLLRFELLQATRNPGEWLHPVLFFVIVIALFPLGVSANLKLLQQIAPGIIWIAALLSSLLAVERVFRQELSEGALEQYLLSPQPLSLLLLIKVVAHWCLTGLPLILLTPLTALWLHLTVPETVTLLLSLAIGTPILSFLTAMTVALTLSIRSNSVLLALLVLPLAVPVVIFGAGSVEMVMSGLSPAGLLWLMAALMILTLSLAPLATATALRLLI